MRSEKEKGNKLNLNAPSYMPRNYTKAENTNDSSISILGKNIFEEKEDIYSGVIKEKKTKEES